MSGFSNASGIKVVDNLIQVIQENKQYLSDIDGEIGDGDHGINMNKGFTMCQEELQKNPGNMTHGFNVLSKILMMKIGGSMGPLYGKFFKAIAKSTEGKEQLSAADFGNALIAIQEAIETISEAKVGDKTLMDCLIPSVAAYNTALERGHSFKESLETMKKVAIVGRDSTKDLVAKIGRASRLGERSRGVLDAGSTSCCLILCSMADTIIELI